MLLFNNITWYSLVSWFVVLGALILINEFARKSKVFSVILCVVMPIVLTVFVWPHTAGEGSSTGTWFHWVKVYSALAECLIFMGIRYFKSWKDNKYILMLPAIRDFQCYGYAEGIVDGVWMLGGPWNIINGIAGILNILTISGWVGIFVSKDRSRDMIWPDQLWFWIIAYDLWNFAYVYNCVSDHSFYAGVALLISCTLPLIFIKKGVWIQNRAYTLAAWMMFTMTFPSFVDTSIFAVQSSHNAKALFFLSLLNQYLVALLIVQNYYCFQKFH